MLRSEHSVKQSRPIWQALASPMPDEALAALRRPKPFGGSGEIMREHVERMRNREYRYTTQPAVVPAVRQVPSGPSGTCKRACRDDAGALGGSQADAPSRRRMRKAEARSYQGPSPSGPERAGKTTRRMVQRKRRGTIANRTSTASPMCSACWRSPDHTRRRGHRCGP